MQTGTSTTLYYLMSALFLTYHLENKQIIIIIIIIINHLLHFSLIQSIILYQLLWATPKSGRQAQIIGPKLI